MFKNQLKYIFSLLFVVISFQLIAQERVTTKSDSSAVSKKVFLNVGIQYISNVTYAGRSDVNNVPIALPTITLVTTSGFFLGTAGYLNLGNQGNFSADGLSFTPGYLFSIDRNKKWGGIVSATQYFFKDSSQVILSSFNSTADLQFYFNPKFARFAVSSSYQIGKQSNDIINTLEVSKNIVISKNKQVSINPVLSFMSGTQSFTETYFQQGSRQRRIITNPSSGGGLGGLFPGGNNQTPKESIVNEPYTEEKQREIKKYQPLSLNLSLPITFKKGKFQANIAPYFIKPINTVAPNSTAQVPSSLFLFSTGLSYTF